MNLQEVNNITMTEGTVRTIHDSNGKLLWGKLNYSTTYDGDTEQDGTPTPSTPVDVDVVTGTQTVTISDGTNTGSFTVNLGTSELCKIDTYQDYIYKSGDDWYLHKEIEKVILDGSEDEDWRYNNTSSAPFRIPLENSGYHINNLTPPLVYTNYYNPVYWDSIDNYNYAVSAFNNDVLPFRNIDITSLTDWKTWVGTHNLTVYYALATPTDTKITDTTLINQLDSIHQFLTRYGYTGIVSGNLPLVITQTTLS